MIHITLTIQKEFHEKVKEYCAKNGYKLSKLVRKLLDEEMKKHETNNSSPQ